MSEESFRITMVLRYPGVVKPRSINKNFVLNLDIAPTLLEAAGVARPGDVQGTSFLPLLNKEKAKEQEAMYYHCYEIGEHAVSPHFGIRTKRYKRIRFYTGERLEAVRPEKRQEGNHEPV